MLRSILPLFLVASMVFDSTAAMPALPMPGGPPSIRLAGKYKGEITRAEWTAADAVKLGGCVADARVTSMTVCIKDCLGQQASLTVSSGNFSQAMKRMIINLPDGAPFNVNVEVKDGRGRMWPVPEAVYMLVH